MRNRRVVRECPCRAAKVAVEIREELTEPVVMVQATHLPAYGGESPAPGENGVRAAAIPVSVQMLEAVADPEQMLEWSVRKVILELLRDTGCEALVAWSRAE